MNIHHIVSAIQIKSDGVASSVRDIANSLYNIGEEITVHSLDAPGIIPTGYNVNIYPHHIKPIASLGRSPEMLEGLQKELPSADIVHVHSLWMMQPYYAFKAIKKLAKRPKICLETHGTLAPWALNRSKLKKKLAWIFLGQKAVAENADLLIATSEKEYGDIRNFGLRQPVAIIPNGVDIPDHFSSLKSKWSKKIVFLARIHPVKGIDILLKCWKRITKDYPEWCLEIAGLLDSKYSQSMVSFAQKLGLNKVKFIGEVSPERKTDFLSSATFFVLPTHTENFGISIAEALSCALPVITTTGTPWDKLNSKRCGCQIELSESNLEKSMRIMMDCDMAEIHKMGLRGREWMADEYSWTVIANKMLSAYKWIDNQKLMKPDFINID